MEKPFILHMFTPGKNVSPFDVNMACDAGWNTVVPYSGVEQIEVADLVQDAIFSRGPKGVRRTGVFIGGRDPHLAMDMLEAARGAMVPPFEVSVFADPSGAFTTAAGMVAVVERHLQRDRDKGLEDKHVLVLGGTGPVGSAAAVMAAQAGAKVVIVGREHAKSERTAAQCRQRYGSDMRIEGAADTDKAGLLNTAEVVLATARAGVEILSAELIAGAPALLVAADVNAVPPSGVAGLGVQDDGAELAGSNSGATGIGALAVGNIKYQTQRALLETMRESDKPVYLGFEQAFAQARSLVA